MGLSRKSATHGNNNKVLSDVWSAEVEGSNIDENPSNHLSGGDAVGIQESYYLEDLVNTDNDNLATTPTSRSVLFGDLTAGLPPPMMNLLEDCTLTNEGCTPTSPPRGIRMLLSLRRHRTSLSPVQPPPSCSLSSSTITVDGNEIFGDMVGSHGAVFPFAALGGFTDQPNAVLAAEANIDDELDEYDVEQNSLVGSSDCVGTTTGASFGRRTGPTSPQSILSITSLFGRQHSSQVGRGLFDSVEATAPWDIVPLVVNSTIVSSS